MIRRIGRVSRPIEAIQLSALGMSASTLAPLGAAAGKVRQHLLISNAQHLFRFDFIVGGDSQSTRRRTSKMSQIGFVVVVVVVAIVFDEVVVRVPGLCARVFKEYGKFGMGLCDLGGGG